jgi:dTDP-glucose 4,6-dehydratase
VPVSIVRPFNTFGPRQSARAFIPTVITQIANACEKIKLGSLHPTRDFTFVKDTAKGFTAVAESEHSVGEVINLGSNFEISMQDTVKMIAEIMGVDIQIEADDQRIRPVNSEVERLWADNSKAFRLTHWKPEYSGIMGFKQGLQETIEWFLRNENKSQYKPVVYNI